MNSKTISVEEAVSSLHEIRKIIDRVQHPGGQSSAFVPRLVIQLGAGLLSGFFLLAEVFTGIVTDSFLLSRMDTEYRLFGISSMGSSLLCMVIIMFCVLEMGAKINKTRTQEYIAKHFSQLSFLSFTSDLLVKFVALSAVIWALRPEWVAPLLLIFTGDYLLQGRLFTLPFRLGLFVGVGCLAMGLWQFVAQEPSLLPALTIFTGVAFISAALTYREMKGFKTKQSGVPFSETESTQPEVA